MVLVLLAVSCLAVVGAATVPAAGWLIPLWITGGTANGALNVCTAVTIASRVPAEAHGRAFSIYGAAVQGAGLFGLIVAGPLAEQFEPRVLVAGAGVLGLLAALACVPLVRREPSVSPPTGRPAEIPDNVAG
jgi:MFS family permease